MTSTKKNSSQFNTKVCTTMDTPKTLPHWGPTWLTPGCGGQLAKHCYLLGTKQRTLALTTCG